MSQLFQVQLRTLDVAAANAFYGTFLALDKLPPAVTLHEQAIARGAIPHWIGFFQVDDVDRATAQFTKYGASPLGPRWVNPAGIEAAVMRDPGGAVVALAKPPSPGASEASEVSCSVLNTLNLALAKAAYGELFGWQFGEPVEIAGQGLFQPFSYRPGAPIAGYFGDARARPGVHAHWLFQFRVASFEAALGAVREGGGLALPPVTTESSAVREHVAVCEDPQRAAFAIRG